MKQKIAIGQAARMLGVSSDTLRYYEQFGLLPSLTRDTAGRRRFGRRDIERIQFIRRAQAMDFTLREIAELLRVRDGNSRERGRARAIALDKLGEIARRREQLALLERDLRVLIGACEAGASRGCPIIDGIQRRGAAVAPEDAGHGCRAASPE